MQQRRVTLADVGEDGFLRRLRRALPTTQPHIATGIGDDAALIGGVLNQALVVSTDVLVENVDFKRQWSSFADVGHKAAAANLSDLAAMGATPLALLAGLQARRRETVSDLLALLKSLHRFGNSLGAPLCGGDLSCTAGPLAISVTAVGKVPKAQALHRGRAQLGDLILCSGPVGAAAAGLWALQHDAAVPLACLRAQRRPQPQVRLGRALARNGRVVACADISDGLAKDAQHLCGPGLVAELDPLKLPLLPALRAPRWQARARAWALHGGEDFGLVVAVRPRHVRQVLRVAQQALAPLHVVGEVRRRGRGRGAQNHGFDHFRALF